MGLEDRDYLREEAQRYGAARGGFYQSGATGLPGGKKRMVTILVVTCVALYLVDSFTPPIQVVVNNNGTPQRITISNQFFEYFSLKSQDVFSSNLLTAPWNLYQLVSYGFAHMSMSTERSLFHIFGNMLVLWMLGRMVEDRYGRTEFLYFFLAGIVFSGLVWGLFHLGGNASVIGASGAVTAVVVVFALAFPHHQVYLFGILPMPAWVVGVLVVGQDFLLAIMGNAGDRVAYEAHLGGAAFGAAYYYFGFRFENFLPTTLFSSMFTRKPGLRVHDPGDSNANSEGDQREAALADKILEKVHREGEQSLTSKERRILRRYGKRLQQKRQ
ncbi:MAG: rhomboid family intramembrane serine protease [Planctomycetota bacterium]|jgi:membrane associated rhomboid family serine protease|nr:rhomboid family intramembrane serine protease [Planctomycetota bacterium]